ncbi:hypothetical protein [Psychroflexus sp. ALD_RP9]|uniref:hypothetical protein n=1 Tax=Psychroflexus sp. ALD_RP9 TaxID=2777186 RepID=UPI001A8F6F11|nr:hypothetical protein [Psychroflexus sp. ALD_RP9]QSS96704.1 hypothetical protein IMZ30_09645 [Psychroflexus sp. ALD_RP9]
MKKGVIITIITVLIIGITYFGIEMFDFAKGVKNDIKIPKQENADLTEKETESESESESEFSEDDCVFDLNTQTDDFLKEIPEFSNYVWDNEKKKATIKLDNGNTLIVTRGGCVHFSFYGNLLLNKSELNFNDENGIFKKALWIAEKLFHKSDYELIKKTLNDKDYEIEKSENQYYLNFKSELYCDMTLVVENLTDQNLISIEIGFYQC